MQDILQHHNYSIVKKEGGELQKSCSGKIKSIFQNVHLEFSFAKSQLLFRFLQKISPLDTENPLIPPTISCSSISYKSFQYKLQMSRPNTTKY